VLAEVGEKRIEGGGVLALGAPPDLAGAMFGDQGQVVVVALVADLVDADVNQPVQVGRVQPVGHHPRADPAHRVPVDAHQPGDRGLVGLGRQKRDEVFEVPGEPGSRPSERHTLGEHPVGRAAKPAQLGAHHHLPAAQIQPPPRRGYRPGVTARPSRVVAPRAAQTASTQRHRHGDHARGKGHLAHGDARQGQQAVKCCSDAHGDAGLRVRVILADRPNLRPHPVRVTPPWVRATDLIAQSAHSPLPTPSPPTFMPEEPYFSIVQRKALSPNAFTDIDQVIARLASFETRYNRTARPFKWKFTTADLDDLLTRLDNHKHSPAQPRAA